MDKDQPTFDDLIEHIQEAAEKLGRVKKEELGREFLAEVRLFREYVRHLDWEIFPSTDQKVALRFKGWMNFEYHWYQESLGPLLGREPSLSFDLWEAFASLPEKERSLERNDEAEVSFDLRRYIEGSICDTGTTLWPEDEQDAPTTDEAIRAKKAEMFAVALERLAAALRKKFPPTPPPAAPRRPSGPC